MASIDEFITSVQSNIEALKQAQASMDGAKQQAEELSSQFQTLGAESMATGAHGLKEGVEQAQGGVIPVITQLEQLITQAQGLKSLRGTGGADTHTRPPPTPLDAAPTALKEPIAKIGDQVTAPGEVSATDDSDRSRFDRFGRGFSRSGAGEVEKLAKHHVTAGKAVGDSYKKLPPSPALGQTHSSIVAKEPASIKPSASQTPGPMDFIGTLVLGTSVVFQAAGHMSKRRRDKKRDERN